MKNRRMQGGISFYVLLLLGLVVMMYMFGFTNTWVQYRDYEAQMAVGNETGDMTNLSIADPDFTRNPQANPLILILKGMINFVQENAFSFGLGITGFVALFVGARLLKIDLSVIYNYAIPIIIITVFLNFFLFPIGSVSHELRDLSISGISMSILLIVLFNIVYVLGIIEYVRGQKI